MKRVVWCVVLVLAVGAIVWLMRPQPVMLELGQPEKRGVREYIAEEAKTRLAQEYTLDAPFSGTVERMALEIGDVVQAGDAVARMDPADLQREIEAVDARIAQARAQMTGVDVAKPKPEDLETAALRVREAQDAVAIAARDRSIARLQLEDADRTLARMNALKGEGIASQQEVDQARYARMALEQTLAQAALAEQSAKKAQTLAGLADQRLSGSIDDNEYQRAVYAAEADALTAQRETLAENLAKAEIKAPVSGPVLEKYIEDRRVIPAGTPLLKLGDLASIELECDVLSEEVVQVEVGDVVEISGKALDDAVIPGSVTRIHPAGFMKISSLGIEQQRVKVRIAFDNAGPNLRAGTRVDVKIVTGDQPDTLAVPERATFRRHDQWHVFTVDGGRAVLTPVTLGLKNESWAEITSGLEADATIVLNPNNDLEPGVRVTAKPE